MTRLFSLAAMMAIGTGALAGQGPALNSQFQAKYDAFVKAYQTRDVKAVARLLADDFNGGDPYRPVTKKQTLNALRKSKSPFRTLSRKVISVVVNGNRASVMEDSVTKGSIPEPTTKKIHAFEIQMRSLDTWEKGANGWQIMRLRKIRTKTLEDGHMFKGDPNH